MLAIQSSILFGTLVLMGGTVHLLHRRWFWVDGYPSNLLLLTLIDRSVANTSGMTQSRTGQHLIALSISLFICKSVVSGATQGVVYWHQKHIPTIYCVTDRQQ